MTSELWTVLSGAVGIALVVVTTAMLHRMFSRGAAHRGSMPEPWLTALVTLVCGLMLVSLVLAGAGLADEPVAYLFAGAAIAAELSVLARVGPLRRVLKGGRVLPVADTTPVVTGAPARPVGRRILLAAVAGALTLIAILIAYRSDAQRADPVTALSVVRTTTGLEAVVSRDQQDHRDLRVRVVEGGRELWSSAPLPDTELARVPIAAAAASAGLGASVELVAGSSVVRSVSAR